MSLLAKFKIAISPEVTDAGKVSTTIGKEIGNVEGKLDGAGLGSKLGKGLAIGAAAGATAIAGLGAAVIKETASMQQNIGGTEAVFADQAAAIQKWGGAAAANMGVSTNEALETANKMGSLFQGMGIEQKKAAQMTMDMSQRAADAASVMGIDLASAMEAVTGAAKGNFTMMDNLGVAMNNSSLEAYALERGMDKTLKQMSDAEKITLAYEMFMDKSSHTAGNFAKENQTLAGSFDSLKASWTSVLGSVEDEEVMDGAIDGLVTSIENISVAITEALPSVVKGVVRIIKEVLPELVKTIAELLPDVVPLLIDGLGEAIGALIEALPTVIKSLGEAVMVLLPALISGIMLIVNALIEALPEIIGELIAFIVTFIPALVNGFIELFLGLIDALPLIINAVVDLLPMIIQALIGTIITMVPALLEGFVKLFMGLIENIGPILGALIMMVPMLIGGLIDAFGGNSAAFVEGLNGFFSNIPESLARLAGEATMGLYNFINDLVTAFPAAMGSFGDGLASFFSQIPDIFMKYIQFVIDYWTGLPGFLWGVGRDIIQGLIDGIASMWDSLMASIGSFVDSIKKGFLEGLGIHSPSRWMRDHIGENMGLGVGVGLVGSAGDVMASVDEFNRKVLGRFSTDASIGVTDSFEAGELAGGNGTTYNTTINQQIPKSDSALDIYLATKRGQLAGVGG